MHWNPEVLALARFLSGHSRPLPRLAASIDKYVATAILCSFPAASLLPVNHPGPISHSQETSQVYSLPSNILIGANSPGWAD